MTTKSEISQAAAALGRSKSEAKTAAARANGAKGGRPVSRKQALIRSKERETGCRCRINSAGEIEIDVDRHSHV